MILKIFESSRLKEESWDYIQIKYQQEEYQACLLYQRTLFIQEFHFQRMSFEKQLQFERNKFQELQIKFQELQTKLQEEFKDSFWNKLKRAREEFFSQTFSKKKSYTGLLSSLLG